MEFHCPICGSNFFGTLNSQDWSIAEGSCHGDGYPPCVFKWPRSEDWKYFRVDPTRPFASKAEFDAAEQGGHDGPFQLLN